MTASGTPDNRLREAYTRKQFFGHVGRGTLAVAGASTAIDALQGRSPAEAATDSTGRLGLKDFGAVGDGVADDGPALQRALDALGAAGGGELVVPPGRFALKGPVFKDFLNLASSIRIVGSGSSSQLLVAPGAGAVAVTIGNLESVVMEGLVLVGTPGVKSDAATVLSLGYCDQGVVRDCGFYGLSCGDDARNAIVFSRRSDVLLSRCGFRGCIASGGVVRTEEWLGLRVEDSWFIDYGTLNGTYHSKTPIAHGVAWIHVREPRLYPQGSADSQGLVIVRNVKADEGTSAVIVDPGTSRVSRVHIDGLEVNGQGGGVGIAVANTDALTIDNSFIGYTSMTTDAIRLQNVKEALISRTFCLQGASRIVADAGCGTLTVEESTYATLSSLAASTNIRKDGRGAIVPKLKAGPISDADFDAAPPDGTMAVDSAASQLSVRIGGVWKSVALGAVGGDTTAPAAPTGLTATAPSSGRVDLSWAANPSSDGVVKYHVQRNGIVIAAPTGTTYSDTSVSPGTSYTYRVLAVDGAGNVSAGSNEVSVTTAAGTAPTPIPLVTSFTPTRLRRDFGGWVGMQLRIGAQGLRVSSVGRWVVAGSAQAHTVKLVDAATGADVAKGSASIPSAGVTVDGFRYAALAEPVTLPAGGLYHLVSEESVGGDPWYDYDTQVVTTAAATDVGAVYAPPGSPAGWAVGGSTGMSYVPPSLLYTVA